MQDLEVDIVLLHSQFADIGQVISSNQVQEIQSLHRVYSRNHKS